MQNENTALEQFENEFPSLSKSFKEIQQQQYELFARKMLSYGIGNISVGTNLATEEEVRLSLSGIWFRMNDKIQRLKRLVLLSKENHIQDESVSDTYMDLSTYGIIGKLVQTDCWKK